MAIESSDKIKGGTNELEKLLEILLLRDQRILGLFKSKSSTQGAVNPETGQSRNRPIWKLKVGANFTRIINSIRCI